MPPATGRPPPGWWVVSARREYSRTPLVAAARRRRRAVAIIVVRRRRPPPSVCAARAPLSPPRCSPSRISPVAAVVAAAKLRHCGVVLHLANPPAPVTRLPASRRCRRRRNFLAVRLPGPSSCLVFLATAAKSSACARDAPRIRPRLSKSTRTAEIKIDAPARGVHLEPNAATSAFRDAGRDKVP